MAIYQYVNNKGVTSTIDANSPTEAMTKAPDIAKDSGVMLVTGQPSTPQPTTPVSSPAPEQGATNNLLSFKDSVNQAVQIAKEKRNKLSLDFMRPLQGTVAASDFNSILGNLNQASDNTTKEALKTATPTYKTEQVGSDVYQFQVDGSGKIIGSPVKILSGEGGSDDPYKNYNAKEAEAIKKAQAKISGYFDSAERDPDGFVTPVAFRNARAAWVKDGYSGADFDKIFSGYANPKNAQDYGVNFQTKVSSNKEDIVNPFE